MAVAAQAYETTRIQYVSDADGNPVGVIVPIDLWRQIESARNASGESGDDAQPFSGDNAARACLIAGANATRHVWDTPEEDAAWAHL